MAQMAQWLALVPQSKKGCQVGFGLGIFLCLHVFNVSVWFLNVFV